MQSKKEPIVVNFVNGQLTDEGIQTVSFGYKSQNDDNNTESRNFIARIGNYAYTGRENVNSNLVVCLWDEVTKKYVPIKAPIYTMVPDVYQTLDVENEIEKKSKELRENKGSATEKFGSAKQKKILKTLKKRNEISTATTNSINNSMSTLVASYHDSIQNFIDDKSLNSDKSLILPSKNWYAHSVDELYMINDLISTKMQKYCLLHVEEFKIWIKELKADLSEEIQPLPNFISHYVETNKEWDDEGNNKIISYLLYWYYLYLFYTIGKKESIFVIVKSHLSEQVATRVLKHLEANFTSNGTVTAVCITKSLCYLSGIALYINKFVINCMPLIQDFEITIDKIKVILKELGCEISTGGNSSGKAKRKRKNSENDNGDVQAILKFTKEENLELANQDK